jgi:hypothetical protein
VSLYPLTTETASLPAQGTSDVRAVRAAVVAEEVLSLQVRRVTQRVPRDWTHTRTFTLVGGQHLTTRERHRSDAKVANRDA